MNIAHLMPTYEVNFLVVSLLQMFEIQVVEQNFDQIVNMLEDCSSMFIETKSSSLLSCSQALNQGILLNFSKALNSDSNCFIFTVALALS